MHETQKIDSVTLCSVREHRSVPLCSVAVAHSASTQPLAFCDWMILIYTGHHSSSPEPKDSLFYLYPARRTKRTMATVVRPDAPHWLPMSTPPTRWPVLVPAPHLRSESESPPQQGREMSAPAPRPIAFGSPTSQGRCSSERLEIYKADTHLDRFNFSIHELVLSGGSFETVFGQVHRIATIVDVREYLHRHTRRKVGRHVIEPPQVSYHFVPATRESFREGVVESAKRERTLLVQPVCLFQGLLLNRSRL